MSEENERLQILEMIERGVISAAQGIQLLNALQPEAGTKLPADSVEMGAPDASSESKASADQTQYTPEPEAAPTESSHTPSSMPRMEHWRRWMWLPLGIGIGITTLSALLMFLAWRSGGFGFWFVCTWFPFLFGLAVLALAAAGRSTRWLHVRIHQKPGEHPQNISISLPIPLRLTAWGLRTFGGRIPALNKTNVDEVLLALEHVSPESPFYVEVDEGNDGERVEVYIG